MYNAVGKYIESIGGKVLAAGGVSIQRWPDDGKHCFYVAVKCTGHAPTFDYSAHKITAKTRKAKKEKAS